MKFEWVVLSLLLACSTGQASAGDELQFSGFGTLGAIWSSSDEADYVLRQANGPGRSRSVAYNIDTLLAGQVDWQISPRLAASAQLLVSDKPDRRWVPLLRVANLRYELADDFHVRAGLLPEAEMLASEYRWVNYGNPFPRLPAEMYRGFAQPDTQRIGIDAQYCNRFAQGNLTWNTTFSQSRLHLARSNASGVDPVRSQSWTSTLSWENQNWKLRLTIIPWGRYRVAPAGLESLLAKVRQADPANARYFDEWANYRDLGLSLAYDSNRWFFQSELFARELRNAWNPSHRAAYATLGRHLERFLPYVTVARLYTRRPLDHPDANAAVAPIYAALLDGQNVSQSSLAFGLAYDLRAGVQIKSQIDLIRPDHGSNGIMTNQSPAYNRADPSTVRLISVSVDFIF